MASRTRRGATFGVAPVHKILTTACYATGQWPYGVRSSRDGKEHDPSTVIHSVVSVRTGREEEIELLSSELSNLSHC